MSLFFTYVLLCTDRKRNRKRFYVGSTDNLEKRIAAHKSKSTKTTKSFDIIELVYYEASLNKKRYRDTRTTIENWFRQRLY